MNQNCMTLARSAKMRGFTLIELLIVMSIIALLAALSMGVFTYSMQSAARNKTASFMQAIASGLEEYKDRFGEYPEPAGAPTQKGGAIFPISGALMLYQAITGDGTDQIDLKGNGTAKASDGVVDADEKPNSINGNLPKGMWVKTTDGYYLVDGFGNPFQYQKAPTTPAGAAPPAPTTINSSYDLWSFAQLNPNKDAAKIGSDLNTKQDPGKTAAWIKNW